MKKGLLRRLEPWLFLFACIVNVLPVLLIEYIPTMDGPSHCYNARILFDLISNPDSNVSSYFQINPWNFTNWTGHILLALMQCIVTAGTAEKILWIIILIAFPYAFRSFVNMFNTSNAWLIWMIFPFTWSQFMFNGFYNFIIGVTFALIFLKFWMQNNKSSFRTGWLIITATLCALSHVFPFVLMLLIGAAYSIWIILVKHNKALIFKKHQWKHLLRSLISLAIVCLPAILITAAYVFSPIAVDVSFAPRETTSIEALNGIRIVTPIIGLVKEEQMFTAKLFYFIMFTVVVAVMISVVGKRRDAAYSKAKQIKSSLFRKDFDFLLIAAALMFFAYFIIFLWFDSGKYVSDRLLYIAFLLLIVWLCQQPFPQWFSVLAAVVAIGCCVGLATIRCPIMEKQHDIRGEFIALADQIPEGSVVYPLNFSGNWLHAHIADYTGTTKPMIILDNYEACQHYFPVKWRAEVSDYWLRAASLYPQISSVDAEGKKVFDYLMTINEQEASGRADYLEFSLWLSNNYSLVGVSYSGNIRLYKPL